MEFESDTWRGQRSVGFLFIYTYIVSPNPGTRGTEISAGGSLNFPAKVCGYFCSPELASLLSQSITLTTLLL